MDNLNYMRGIEAKKEDFILKEKVEAVYERRVTPLGTPIKLDALLN